MPKTSAFSFVLVLKYRVTSQVCQLPFDIRDLIDYIPVSHRYFKCIHSYTARFCEVWTSPKWFVIFGLRLSKERFFVAG